MKNKRIYLIIIIAIAGFILFYYRSSYQANTPMDKAISGKLQVTASFYPLYFFASEIGGGKADIKNITPAGVEPHDYDPSAQDIAYIEKGDMLVLNGSLEAWGDKIRDNLKGANVKIIIAGDSLLTKELSEEGETLKDPHIWLNPRLAKKVVAKITDGFISIDPANKLYYQENGSGLAIKLDQLDSVYKKGLQNCKNKDFITSHEAFAYLAEAYGLNQVAISGISPDVEPSAQDLVKVADFAKNNNVKYIFFEALVSPKLSETIAKEIGAQILVLDPIEGLSDDDIRSGKNYFTVMEDNLRNLQIALQCSN